MRGQKYLAVIGIICTVSVFVMINFIFTSANAAESKPIKVGIVGSISGPVAPFNLNMVDGFKYGINKINAEGGILGRRVEYIMRDDKMLVEVGLRMAKELIMREDVDVLAGTIFDAVCLALAQYSSAERKPFYAWVGGPEIGQAKGFGYAFQPWHSSVVAGNAMAYYMIKKGYKKFWFAGGDAPFDLTIMKAAWQKLQQLDPNVKKLGETIIPFGEIDYAPYIGRIAQSKPEAIILGTGAQAMVPFMKAAKAINYKPKSIVMTGIDQTVLQWLGEEAPEGFYGTSDYLWYYPNSPQNVAFVKDFMDKVGKYPSMFEWVGYMTAVTMKLGYEKAGKVDADEFVRALVGMKFDTPIGQLKIRTDHLLESPIFIGTTYKSPKYPKFLIAKDIESAPTEKIYPPEPKD